MPNKRRPGTYRVTLTLDKELLRQMKINAEKLDINRLEWLREAIVQKLAYPMRPNYKDFEKAVPPGQVNGQDTLY